MTLTFSVSPNKRQSRRRQTVTQLSRQCDDTGRDQSDVSKSQGTARDCWQPQEARRET